MNENNLKTLSSYYKSLKEMENKFTDMMIEEEKNFDKLPKSDQAGEPASAWVSRSTPSTISSTCWARLPDSSRRTWMTDSSDVAIVEYGSVTLRRRFSLHKQGRAESRKGVLGGQFNTVFDGLPGSLHDALLAVHQAG